jgi:ELWxxDGT repeat protein
MNGTIFFPANDGINGTELWKSDGTAAGTILVKNIRSGSGSSNPFSFTNVDGVMFFIADDGVNGSELWKTDGTTSGTVLVKDIIPGSSGGGHSRLTNFNGILFFQASDGITGELWKSDGTSVGTVLVKNINPSSGGAPLTNVNGTLYFEADDGIAGLELWKSDGTSDGTALVRDINPGSGHSFPNNLADFMGSLFFVADNGTTGQELWMSDGTEDGTVLVKDINPGANGSAIDELTTTGNILFFEADDGTTGVELWAQDFSIDMIINNIDRLLDDPTTPDNIRKDLQKAKDELQEADVELENEQIKKAFDDFSKAVQELTAAQEKGAEVSDIIVGIVSITQQIAQNELKEAQNFAGTNAKVDREIEKAEEDLAHANRLFGEGNFLDAVNNYQEAWQHANKAITLAMSLLRKDYSAQDIEKDKLNALPEKFKINQNYPNPFNPETAIIYELPKQSHVTLKIFDILGKEVRTLVNEVKPVGTHRLLWDGRDEHGAILASGVYFYRLEAGREFKSVMKMLLMR